MPSTQQAPESVEHARHRRAELLAAIHSLERALATPSGELGWVDRVQGRYEVLTRAFAEHVGLTEGVDGIYADVLRMAPRLRSRIDRLVTEHAHMSAALSSLGKLVCEAGSVGSESGDLDEGWAHRIRDEASLLLARLVRHRQRGADLVFEAYHQDIGGCD